MNKILKLALLFIVAFVCVSCERYPLTDVVGLHPRVKKWPSVFYIYNDEIKTKGSFEPKIWAGSRFLQVPDDKDILNFKCNEGALGAYCIKMSWNDNNPYQFAGWGLAVTEYEGGHTDMSDSGYNCLEFYAKGYLTEGCVFEISVPSSGGSNDKKVITKSDLSSGWTKFEIPLTGKTTNYWNSMEYYISVNMYRENDSVQTGGGTVYIDNIRYCKK